MSVSAAQVVFIDKQLSHSHRAFRVFKQIQSKFLHFVLSKQFISDFLERLFFMQISGDAPIVPFVQLLREQRGSVGLNGRRGSFTGRSVAGEHRDVKSGFRG